MKLVVRVQYVGDRARQLLHDDQAAEYTKGLIDDLEHFGFPMPHEQKPIEKSGFMLCVWHVERESDMHHAIQDAFINAKSEASSLLDRSIRYISLNEDGVTHTTSLMNKPYKPKTYVKPDMLPPQTYPGSTYNKPYGKAPKYPTIISQARRGVTPLPQRVSGADSSGHRDDYVPSDVDMLSLHERTPPKEGSSSVIDVTQQTLLQLSQSSAFQSLLQRSNPSSPTKPESSADLLSLLRGSTGSPPARTEISNLQALLEKAGVKSSTAQAILSGHTPSSTNAPLSPPMLSPGSTASMSGTSMHPQLTTSSLPSPPSGSGSALGPPLFPRPLPSAAANEVLRELWDVRRQLNAHQVREKELMDQLRRLGQPVPAMDSSANAEAQIAGLQEEIAGLREALRHEQQTRRVAEATLRAERMRSDEIETAMQVSQPSVVPALLDAFMKIGQMTGETLRDLPGTGPNTGIGTSTSSAMHM